MSVKRWQETESWGFTEWDCMAVMEERADGEYVLHSDYAALQAKVERLTKAGIAMGMALPDTDEANAAYRSFERVVKS